MSTSVVLVHGWGGSFDSTWERSGVAELVRDLGRDVIGVDLLGHGTAPRPHDPAAYADLTARILDALPAEPVDAVGFSLGARTLLEFTAAAPHRIRRLVVAGVGGSLLQAATPSDRLADAVECDEDDDHLGRLFASYARADGNDPTALAAVLRRPHRPLEPELLSRIACPVLVAVGDADDLAGPPELLVEALPAARLRILRRTDHFATPGSFDFIDAMLGFIGES